MGTCKLLIILGLLSNVVALSTCCSKKVVELPQQLIVEPMGETILNPVVEAYMDEVSYDADYSQTQILNYCSIQTEYRKDQPKPIEIQSDYHSGTLLVSSDSAFAHIVREINVLQKEDLFLPRFELTVQLCDDRLKAQTEAVILGRSRRAFFPSSPQT